MGNNTKERDSKIKKTIFFVENTKNKPSRKLFTVTSRLAKKPTDPPFLTSRCVTKNYKTHPPPYRDEIIECPQRVIGNFQKR